MARGKRIKDGAKALFRIGSRAASRHVEHTIFEVVTDAVNGGGESIRRRPGLGDEREIIRGAIDELDHEKQIIIEDLLEDIKTDVNGNDTRWQEKAFVKHFGDISYKKPKNGLSPLAKKLDHIASKTGPNENASQGNFDHSQRIAYLNAPPRNLFNPNSKFRYEEKALDLTKQAGQKAVDGAKDAWNNRDAINQKIDQGNKKALSWLQKKAKESERK